MASSRVRRDRRSAVFGLFAARTGYPVAFALTGILVLAVLPAALREQKAVASPAEAGAPS